MRKAFIIFPVLLLLFLASCQKPPKFGVEEGSLDFSDDTLFFDTLFTNFDSPSERLIITNRTENHILIAAIWLEGGEASDFSLIVNGIESLRIEEQILASGDSLVAFVRYNSAGRDEFIRDRILIQIGDNVQDVDIEAWVMDAVYYSDDTLPAGIISFDPSKRYVIDGKLTVPVGGMLIIPAGTQLHFTPRKDENFNLISGIFVEGSLDVRGIAGNEPVFQGSRFGRRYEESPGQWRGIEFSIDSRSNKMVHALVKNALIGLQVDYATNGAFPKLKIRKSEIRNMGAFGILGIGYSNPGTRAMIHAENTLVHNCQEATVALLGGGDYRFWNCTFANYSMDFRRGSPQLWLNNYDPDALVPFELNAEFVNCLIWGSEEDEVVPDSLDDHSDIFNYSFRKCIIRTTLALKGSDNKISQENEFPKFRDPTRSDAQARDYRPGPNSPAINAGLTQPYRTFYQDDLSGLPRGNTFDIGAYEYGPQ